MKFRAHFIKYSLVHLFLLAVCKVETFKSELCLTKAMLNGFSKNIWHPPKHICLSKIRQNVLFVLFELNISLSFNISDRIKMKLKYWFVICRMDKNLKITHYIFVEKSGKLCSALRHNTLQKRRLRATMFKSSDTAHASYTVTKITYCFSWFKDGREQSFLDFKYM